ncbi:MAG: hypothetical protein ACI3XG_08115 [Faecousia sp.]
MKHKGDVYDSTYVFSSDQQKEVEKIYQKYLTPENEKKTLSEEEEKMEQLRKLDRSVAQCGSFAGFGAGFGGAVLHGIGTALFQNETMFLLGTVIAFAGLLLFLAAYPIYSYAVKKRRRKVEAQILKLCKELMK